MDRFSFLACAIAFLGVDLPASAQEPSSSSTPAVTTQTEATPSETGSTDRGVKRALLVCGLSGSEERRKAFAETLNQLHSVLVQKLGFAASDITVLFGDAARKGLSEPAQSALQATREELEKQAAQLREKLKAEDVLWVIVLGHTHYDGRNSHFNLPGPDLHQGEFGKLFEHLPAAQQVFIVTTPASGFYVKPLSAPGRVVITATEADWETNETEFPTELARVFTSPPSKKELDVDQDGQVTLLDVYLTVARNLAQSYVDRELLATEHPLLDDNGDGRGMEVQIDFLSPELGGRARLRQDAVPTLSPRADGHLAKTIPLPNLGT